MSGQIFYNCSQHNDSQEECNQKGICEYIGNKCMCYHEVSGSNDPAQCTCMHGYKPNYDNTDCIINCPAGQFALDDFQCASCLNGTVSPAGASSSLECTSCNADAPVANPGHTKCITDNDCTKIANASMQGTSQCTCNGAYVSDKSGDKCINLCPSGTYMLNNRCQSCQDGTYSQIGADKCIPCPDGLVANFMKNACVEPDQCGENLVAVSNQCSCVAGRYRKDDFCEQCPHGDISEDGQSCTSCGQQNPESIASIDHKTCISADDCRAIQDADVNNNQCECNIQGYQVNNEEKRCVNPCLAGTYYAGGYQSPCTMCERGQWSQNGANQCQQCDDLTQVVNPAHTKCITKDQCTGMSNSLLIEAENQCTCLAGYEANSNGECAECHDGFTSTTGSGICIPCDINEVANLQRTHCVDLRACGENAEAYGTQCYCAAGLQRTQTRDACEECPPNHISPVGSNTCIECAANTEIVNEARSACLCAENHGIESKGKTECKPCGKGKKHDVDLTKDAKEVCDDSIACDAATEILASNGKCVCADSHGRVDGNKCTACAPGSYHKAEKTDTDKVACSTCTQDQPANLEQTGCIPKDQCCDNIEAVDNQCYCAAGYGLQGGACVAAGEGQISPRGTNAFTTCQEGTKPNETKTECVAADSANTNKVNIAAAIAIPIVVVVLIIVIAVSVLLIKKRKQPDPGRIAQSRLEQLIDDNPTTI